MCAVLPVATQDARKPAVLRLALIQRRTREGLWVWVFPLLALAVGVGIFAPRFWITAPSLIDDWFAITYAPTAVHELVHGHYNPSLVDYGGRYRPAYAVLAYLQWTVLGGAHSVFLPTLFGLFRLLFFMAAVAALAILIVRDRATRRWQIIVAAVTPAFVLATPGVSYNFVRFGVAEPTAFACVVLALFAITAAIRIRAIGGEARTTPRAVALFIVGYLTYLFGVYLWEPSVVVALALPVLYLWLYRDPELRSAALPGRRTLAVLSILLIAPLAHVAYEVARTTSEGKKAGVAALLCAPIAVVALRLCTRWVRWSNRRALLCVAMIAAGVVAAYVSHAAGGSLSRYYIPFLVANAVTAARFSTRISDKWKWRLLAIVSVSLFLCRPDLVVSRWLHHDEISGAAISMASDAYATNCPVYLVGFNAERSVGLARLLESTDHSANGVGCTGPSRAFALVWPSTKIAPPLGCTGDWKPVERQRSVTLLACQEFRQATTIPSQDRALNVHAPVVRLVKPSGFVPASTLKSIA